jgi:hypothetical protein
LKGTEVNIRNAVVIDEKRPEKDTPGFVVRLDPVNDARANVKARTRTIMRTWLSLAAVHGAAVAQLSTMRDLYKAAHRKALRDFCTPSPCFRRPRAIPDSTLRNCMV